MSPNIFESGKSDGGVINLAIIQPSTDPFKKFDNDYLNDIEQEFVSLSSQAAEKADILVWPEAPLPYTSESARSQDLIKNIEGVYSQAVASYAMPPGNVTFLENSERKTLYDLYHFVNKL